MVDPQTGEIVGEERPAPFQYGLPFVRTPYNYDRMRASDESGLYCPEPTRTQQQFKEETDINTIVERFGITGELPSNLAVPQSGDFVDAVTDYQSAMNLVILAQRSFQELPAKVRARFGNDPAQLVEFVSDEANRDEARALGLLVPENKPQGGASAASAPPPPRRIRRRPEKAA